MLQAGEYLKQTSLNGKVGAWNAGIINYYEGGHVVNIDGLVNNDIYMYAINNTLPSYLSSKDIKYIIDFKNMLDYEGYRLRSGYNDLEFLENLKPIMVFDHGEYRWWQNLTLYQIMDD